MKRWLIMYDIRDRKRLNKTARILEGLGDRVQKSVFEALATRKKICEIEQKISHVIDSEEDYVVFFSICLRDWEKREKFGQSFREMPAERDYEII